MPPRSRPRPARLAAKRPHHLAAAIGLGVLLWSAALFAVALVRFGDRLLGPPRPVGVTAWNPGEYESARLERFLAAVEPHVPPGRVVVFATDAPADQELFQSLWAAYHLPRHRVIRSRHPAAGAAGEYLVVFDGGAAAPAGGEELLRRPEGALYRLPGAAAGGG